MKLKFGLTAFLAIGVLVFGACIKKGETEKDFSIYGVWRYTGSADVEHGETWVAENITSISIYNDNGECLITSGNYVWYGNLEEEHPYYRFLAHTYYDLNSGETHNVVQGHFPYTYVFTYDSENRRLFTADHTVEEYYVWAGESSYPDLSAANEVSRDAQASGGNVNITNKVLSDFAGTYISNSGNIIQLKLDGFFIMQQSGNIWENEIAGGFKTVYETYGDYFHWGHPAGDFGIYLVPANVDIIMHGSVFPTDNTKIRLITEDLHSDPVVYYRELSAENDFSAGDPSGQWRFESGNIVFFKQASADFDANGFIKIWEIGQGETYVSGGKNILETGSWRITDGGELAVYHESGVDGAFYYSFTVRDEVLSITDRNGNTAVYKRIYPQ